MAKPKKAPTVKAIYMWRIPDGPRGPGFVMKLEDSRFRVVEDKDKDKGKGDRTPTGIEYLRWLKFRVDLAKSGGYES